MNDYEAIRDALDDLASAVNERYAGYPATDRRYVRDLAVVTQASAALQRLESRPTPEQSGEARERAESDALTLVGHAEYLRGMEQSDMPSWFLGLAERIARGAGLMMLADRCAAMDRSALGREA